MAVDSKLDARALHANKNLAARNYWKERLRELEYTAYFESHRSAREPQYTVCEMVAPAAVHDGLHRMAGADKAKHIVLLAALAVLIQKSASVKELLLFTPLYGGNQHDGEQHQLVPVRINIQDDHSFESLLSKVKDNLLLDFRHGNYPVDKILHGSKEEWAAADFIGMGLDALQPLPDKDAFPFGIFFQFQVREQLSVAVQFDAMAYDQFFISQLVQRYFYLLGELIQHSKKTVAAIELISPEEKHTILHVFNNTQKDFPLHKTVIDFFLEQVQHHPEKIAIRFEDQQLTYSELNKRANQVAHYLLDHFTESGAIIGVQLNRSLDLMIAIFGILKAGCTYMPFTMDYPMQRVQSIMRSSHAKIIFTDQTKYLDHSQDFTCIEVNEAIDYFEEEINLATPESIAYIIYTSGSTGQPKGVMIRHRSLVNRLHWMQEEYGLNESDIILQKTPVVFDVSVWELFWWCFNGAQLTLAAPGVEKDPEALSRIIAEENITTIHFVPTMLHAWLSYLKDNPQRHSLQQLQRVFASGEELTVSIAQLFFEQCPHTALHNLYGPTEATVDVSFHDVLPATHYKRIPIGKPINNTCLYIFNENMQLQPVGIPGQLYIGGENLFAGYVNQPELTQEKLVADPLTASSLLYKTGDLARWLPDGNIEFLGRMDDQVKIRGNRIELGEIAHVIDTFPGVQQTVVLTKKTNDTTQLVAYLVSDDDFPEEKLRQFLRARLPEYMMPAWFVLVDSIPLTVNGKADRKKLLALTPASSAKYRAPGTELEKALAAQWKNILGVPQVGIHDHFFRIGGDSILAVRAIGLINHELSVQLSMPDLYEHPTISELAVFIETTSFRNEEAQYEAGAKELAQFRQDYLAAHPDDNIEAVYPMSSIEKAMCFVSLSRPDDILYFEQIMQPVVYEKLNIPVLQQALDMMVQKHEALRTAFDMSVFAHVVYKSVQNNIIFHDLSDLPEEEQKEVITRYLEKSRLQPFELSAVPVWRIIIYRLRESFHEVLFEYHHAILDGWSIASLITEWNNIYVSLLRNQLPDMRPLAISYRDYIITEVMRRNDQEATAWWQQELKGFRKLSFNRNSGTKTFKSYRYAYPFQLLQDLERSARQQDKALKTLLLAAHVYALKVLTGENDILVGLVTFTRSLRKDGEKLLGCFLNTIPFRTQVPDASNWLSFVQQIDDKLMEVKKYEHLSLFQINQAIGGRSSEDNPLFDILFNYVNWHVEEGIKTEKMVENNIDRLEFDSFLRGHTFFDVTYNVNKERILCMHEYASPFMPEETFVDYLEIFNATLRRIIETPEAGMDAGELFWNAREAAIGQQLKKQTRQPDGRQWTMPLSYQQESWWQAQQHAAIPMIIDWEGDINISWLNQSMEAIVRRHDALRVQVFTINGKPLQHVSDQVLCSLEIRAVNEGAHELQELMDAALQEPFEWERTLMRPVLFRKSENSFTLMILFHPLIVDRFSVNRLTEELLQHYQSLAEHGELNPPLPASSFTGYAAWQRDHLPALKPSFLPWWKEYLGMEHEPFALPGDRPSATPFLFEDAHKKWTISESLADQVLLYEKHTGHDAGLILMAAFLVLLHKYTEEEVITIGARVENRSAESLQGMIGPLANLLTIKTNFAAGNNFEELLNTISNIYSKIEQHQHIPFELLNEELSFGQNRQQAELFNIVYEYEDDALQLPALPDVHYRINHHYSGSGSFNLALFVRREEGQLTGALHYNAHQYSSSMIDTVLQYYHSLLHQLLTHPAHSLATMHLETETERRQWVEAFNDTARTYPEGPTILHLFSKQVALTPGNIALESGTSTLTYYELDERSGRFAHYLQQQIGIKPGDLVALLLEREAWALIAILGIMKAGAAYVPLDVAYPPARIDTILQDAQPRALITRRDGTHADHEWTVPVIDLNALEQSINECPVLTNTTLKSTDLAYVIYTSGSTGVPKGVMVSQQSLVNYIRFAAAKYVNDEPTAFPLYSSLAFDLTVTSIFTPLVTGNRIIIYGEKESVLLVEELLLHNQCDIIKCTPSHLKLIRDADTAWPAAGSRIKKIIVGGEEFETHLAKEIHEKFQGHVTIYNEYGPTEATVGCMIYTFDPGLHSFSVPIGCPIPNIQVYLLNKHLQPVPVGVQGELYISGEGLANGYLHQATLTAQKFMEHPFLTGKRLYCTGDQAIRLPDGNLVFLGRMDEQVKIRGFRIELGEIEHHLLTFPAVKEAVVLARGEGSDKHLVAYYVNSEPIETAAWKAHLLPHLPEYMIPAFFVRMDSLPLTTNGKLNKQALPEPAIDLQQVVQPGTDMEMKLAALWAEVLQLDAHSISMQAGFFELGGHSLMAPILVSRIHQALQVEINIKDLYDHPTIAAMASFFEKDTLMAE